MLNEIPTNSPEASEPIAPLNPENSLTPETPLKPEKPALDPINQYTDTMNRKNELNDQIKAVSSQTAEDNKNLSTLRQSMGLPPSETDLNVAGDQYLSQLQKQKQDVENIIKDEERGLLGVPENEQKSKDTKAHTEALQPQGKEDFEKFEEVEKEAREKFVQEFIDSAIQKMLDEFKTFVSESNNADNAEQLIKKKTALEVQNRAKDFIENAGEPDFGFEAEIIGAEFDGPKGEKVKYVTELNIKFEDGTSSVDNDTKNNEKLIDLETENQMQKAKEQKNLKESKTKAD